MSETLAGLFPPIEHRDNHMNTPGMHAVIIFVAFVCDRYFDIANGAQDPSRSPPVTYGICVFTGVS